MPLRLRLPYILATRPLVLIMASDEYSYGSSPDAMVVAGNLYGPGVEGLVDDLETLVCLAVVLLQAFSCWFPWHLRIEHGTRCRLLCLQK